MRIYVCEMYRYRESDDICLFIQTAAIVSPGLFATFALCNIIRRVITYSVLRCHVHSTPVVSEVVFAVIYQA